MHGKIAHQPSQNDEFTALLKQCVHCGLCLEACPTYMIFRTEMDSPRGRISLMRALDEGVLGQDALQGSFKEHLTLCLSCLACETACPSTVQYGKLIEITNKIIEEASPPSMISRWIQWVGFEYLMPHLRRLKLLAKAVWAYQASGIQKIVRRFNLLPGLLGTWENILPQVSLDHIDNQKIFPPHGTKHGKGAWERL